MLVSIDLQGTPEESRILLLSAEHLLKRRNVQGALDLLGRIKPTDSCYVEAKSKHAQVLLEHRKDKYAYLRCYQDFVDENATAESYVLLGDAYMNVLGECFFYLLCCNLYFFRVVTVTKIISQIF